MALLLAPTEEAAKVSQVSLQGEDLDSVSFEELGDLRMPHLVLNQIGTIEFDAVEDSAQRYGGSP